MRLIARERALPHSIGLLLCLILLSSTFILPSPEQQPGGKELLGSWSSPTFRLDLLPNGSFEIELNEKDAKQSLRGQFVLDTGRRPLALTLRGIPGQRSAIHTSISLIDSSTLTLAPFSPAWRLRALAFDQDALVLHRTGPPEENE